MPFAAAQYFLTVQSLFSYLRLAVASDAHVIEVEYDDVLAYPTRIFVDWQQAVADDEVAYVVHSLAAP